MTNSTPQIKLYRGSNTSNLPENREDGAIYVIADPDDDHRIGTVFADIGSTRFKLEPTIDLDGYSKLEVLNMADLNANPGTISTEGTIYVINNVKTMQIEEPGGQTKTIQVPGIKIGNAGTPIIDLPFIMGTREDWEIVDALRTVVDNLSGDVNDLKSRATTLENSVTTLNNVKLNSEDALDAKLYDGTSIIIDDSDLENSDNDEFTLYLDYKKNLLPNNNA